MGSKTFEGLRFSAYTEAHAPPHVHGFYGGVEVVLEIDPVADEIRLSNRSRRIKPANARISDIRRIVRVANDNSDELFELWEAARP